MVDAFNYFQVPHLLGDPSKGVSYGKLDDMNEISAASDLVDAGFNQRKRLIAQQESKISVQELRLHEAINEVYADDHPLENNSEFDNFLEKFFPEPVAEKLDAKEVQKTIMGFERAKEILAPLADEYQAKVTVEDFEEAYRYFVNLASNDFEATLRNFARQESELRKSAPKGNVANMIESIQSQAGSGGKGSRALNAALSAAGLKASDLNRYAGKVDKFLNQESLLEDFYSHFAQAFFFLREQAPKEMADGIVYESIAKPFFEEIAKRTSDPEDLKKPKKPDASRIKNKKTLSQKQRTYKKKNIEFPIKVEASIAEMYKLISERLGDNGSALISQRLEELS